VLDGRPRDAPRSEAVFCAFVARTLATCRRSAAVNSLGAIRRNYKPNECPT